MIIRVMCDGGGYHDRVLLLTRLLLAGCDTHRAPARKVSSVSPDNNIKPVVTVVSDKLNDIEKMERCRRELAALKRIDIRIYNQRKGEFDRVMQGADIYSGVRSDIKGIHTRCGGCLLPVSC